MSFLHLKIIYRCENVSSHMRLNCTSHLTPVMTLITDQSTFYSEVRKLNFTVHLWSFQVSNPFLHKYQPSSGQTSSLLMKTSHLSLKLVEFNFFASFTTDDQSNFNVSNTSKSSRWTFSIAMTLHHIMCLLWSHFPLGPFHCCLTVAPNLLICLHSVLFTLYVWDH